MKWVSVSAPKIFIIGNVEPYMAALIKINKKSHIQPKTEPYMAANAVFPCFIIPFSEGQVLHSWEYSFWAGFKTYAYGTHRSLCFCSNYSFLKIIIKKKKVLYYWIYNVNYVCSFNLSIRTWLSECWLANWLCKILTRNILTSWI